MNIKAVTQQVEMLVFKTRLDTNLDVLATQLLNNWIDEEALEETLEYLSIEKTDFISYIQKEDWFDDNQKILDLIEVFM
tara:strand:- start:1298 stop:1534 length:237 start_codon:yes stop_codon:yes gene_type:complete